MRVTIDGEGVSPDRLAPPAMNYGQLHRWEGFARHEYECVMSVDAFVDAVGPWFAKYGAEIRADDLNFPPDEGSPDAEFAAAGYPSLSELIDKHPGLFECFLPAFGGEINDAFHPGNVDAIRYSVNSVDWIRLDGGEVRFGGVAFDVGDRGAP